MVSVVVVVEPPRPTAHAMMATRMIAPITTNQIVLLGESSDELDESPEESPPEDAWVVSGAFVVVAALVVVGASVEPLPESSLDDPEVTASPVPESTASLHPAVRPTVATTRSAIA